SSVSLWVRAGVPALQSVLTRCTPRSKASDPSAVAHSLDYGRAPLRFPSAQAEASCLPWVVEHTSPNLVRSGKPCANSCLVLVQAMYCLMVVVHLVGDQLFESEPAFQSKSAEVHHCLASVSAYCSARP